MREITIGAAAALTAALLATGPAEANDRGLKESFRTIAIPGGWSYGIGFYADAPDTGMSLHCPLPVNNVDLDTSSKEVTAYYPGR